MNKMHFEIEISHLLKDTLSTISNQTGCKSQAIEFSLSNVSRSLGFRWICICNWIRLSPVNAVVPANVVHRWPSQIIKVGQKHSSLFYAYLKLESRWKHVFGLSEGTSIKFLMVMSQCSDQTDHFIAMANRLFLAVSAFNFNYPLGESVDTQLINL